MTVGRDAIRDRAAILRGLHQGPAPLILPNAWDVASAQAVERAGAAAVATSSGALAGARGYPDGEVIPVDELFALLARIADAVTVPVTADMEGGYGLAPAELVGRLAQASVVGFNIEDTQRQADTASLVPMDEHAARIAELVAAAEDSGFPMVINARVDSFLRGTGDPEARLTDGLSRARAYLAAGADCVYPIFLADAEAIGRFVSVIDAPVNILLRPGVPPIDALTRLGVRRISVGSGLWRLETEHLEDVARRLVNGDGSSFANAAEG